MRSLVFAILLAQLPCAQVLSATIAAKGRSDYRIVSGRNPVERFAAEELARYIEKISGVGLPVSAAEVDGPALSVGRTGLSERAGIRVPSRYQDDDGFVIRSIGDDVVLVGANTRGTLYAVYAFLEKIGCRWYAPNFELYEGRAEFVPRLATIEVGRMDVLEQADWRYRKTDCGAILSHTVERWEQIFDWMAKTRRNRLCYHLTLGRKGWDVWGEKLLPGLQKRGLKVEVGKHNAYRVFLPRSVFKAHP